MSNERIVALFDTPAHADLALQDLLAAGLPESAVERHAAARDDVSYAGTAGTRREPGFWSRLFGGEPEHDSTFYDRSLESGATIVTVLPPADRISDVVTILEGHHPVDMDERAESYGYGSGRPLTGGSVDDPTYGAAPRTGTTGLVGTPGATAGLDEPSYAGSVVPEASGLGVSGTAPYATGTTAGTTSGGLFGGARDARATTGAGSTDAIPLSAEEITVSKRLVNRGGTRIRRYVVETPVSEDVTLHDERVVVDRRPVEAGRAVEGGAFTDRSIEMTETAEEAVVGKTARVVEEVVLRKEAVDRVETVRDTVRREEVEVERMPGTGSDATDAARSPKI